jgi:hypothetical protein
MGSLQIYPTGAIDNRAVIFVNLSLGWLAAYERGWWQAGTTEFMSRKWRRAIDVSQDYVQASLDDLWAFFHTAVWAALFHAHRPRMDESVEGRVAARAAGGFRERLRRSGRGHLRGAVVPS